MNAVLFYVSVRAAGVLTLFAAANWHGRDAQRILSAWDAQWYAGIAEDGYGFTRVHPDGRFLSDYAFFPLYPLCERVVAHLSGISYVDAGLLISTAAAPLAALGIYKSVRSFSDARTAFMTVALWGALPISVVQSMAYTESLFTAMAAWSLYSAQRGRWLSAGALAGAAALTRPTGVAVVLALVVAVAIDQRTQWHQRSEGSFQLSGILRPAISLLLAGAGSVTYLAWVAIQRGSLGGYFSVTAGWENTFDGGVAFATWIFSFLSGPAFGLGLALILAVAGIAWLFVRILRDGVPAPLVVYAATLLTLSFGTSGYFGSKPRYLLPAFVLLIPLASWLAQRRRRWRVIILVSAVACSLAYGTVWLLGSGPP